MSAKLMGQVWEIELPHNEQTVMLALADHGEDDGSQIFPSIDRLVWKTGYQERQVQNILRALERKGLIEPVAYAQGGRGHATEYKMNIEKGAKKPPFVKGAKSERVQNPAQRVQSTTIKGAKSSTKGAIAIAPQPSENHQLEPSIEPSGSERRLSPPAPPAPEPIAVEDKSKAKTTKSPPTPTRRTNGQVQRPPEHHVLCEELVDGLSEVSGMLRQTNRSALYTAGWTLVNLLDAGITPSKEHIIKAFGQTDPGPGHWWWYRDDQRVKIDRDRGRDDPMPKPHQVVEMYTVSLRPVLSVVGLPPAKATRPMNAREQRLAYLGTLKTVIGDKP